MTVGILMMTALPPTGGHEYAIRFAATFMSRLPFKRDRRLSVVVPTRTKEPIPGHVRATMIRQIADRIQMDIHNVRIMVRHIPWDDAPQNLATWKGDESNFWKAWRHEISKHEPVASITHFFSSEPYGNEMAEILGAQHITIDPNRDIHDVKASLIRGGFSDDAPAMDTEKIGWHASTYYSFCEIPAETRKYLTRRYVIFGAESVGKTTIAKRLSFMIGAKFYPEWARPHLETTGVECDQQAMYNISIGQTTQELIALQDPPMLQIMDTDALSTLGYYLLSGMDAEADPNVLRALESHVCKFRDITTYILLDNSVPFVADPLRFGGDVRESSTEFWKNLLDTYRCHYKVIDVSGYENRYQIAEMMIGDHFMKEHQQLGNFQREGNDE